jgi:dTDP-4-dehydrorhamnose 3,5-epimerase
MHFQVKHPQAQIVTVIRAAFLLTVDLRRGSPNFGQWFGVELSDEGGTALYGARLLRPERFRRPAL